MKTYCLGDPHGGYKAVLQCLERSEFNKEEDKLICIGDVADGYSEVPQCFEELLSIKNLVYVMGNHDIWLLDYLKFGATPYVWLSQGGQATLNAYLKVPELMEKHRDFLNKCPYYYIEGTRLFIHGGFNTMHPLLETSYSDMTWDRDMWFNALDTAKMTNVGKASRRISHQLKHINDYTEIYIGHTSTSKVSDEPVNVLNIWNIDQGGGWEGKLSIINIDTKEYFQSDFVYSLYLGERGR